MAKITRELLDAGRSSRNGWSAAQLALLGYEYPNDGNWKHDCINLEIPDEIAEQFVALKDKHIKVVKNPRKPKVLADKSAT